MLPGGAYFTVPNEGCVCVGRIFFLYFRLPPGSLEEVRPVIDEIGHKATVETIYFVYLPSGGLVPASVGADLPDENGRNPGAENYVVQVASFVTK